jgi:hypothetical protein
MKERLWSEIDRRAVMSIVVFVDCSDAKSSMCLFTACRSRVVAAKVTLRNLKATLSRNS